MASVVERFLDPLIISPTKDLGMGTAVEQSLHRDGFSAAHKRQQSQRQHDTNR
jgi:hypothetical protein